MNVQKENQKLKKWGSIALILISMVALLFIFMQLVKKTGNESSSGFPPEIVLSALLILGVVTLIVSLSFLAVMFKSIGLADRTTTLGLPEGSVRAIIALTLILLFMMTSVFLYWQVNYSGRGVLYTSTNVTQEILDSFPKEEVVEVHQIGTYNNETVYNVTRLVYPNTDAGKDIAQQIITVVSTLVVAISGFYFGTKAVEGTKVGDTKSTNPSIDKIQPNALIQGEDKELTIYGKNLNQVSEVKLTRGAAVAILEELKPAFTTITGKLKTENMDVGKWTVVVVNADGKEVQLPDGFEVKSK